MSLVVSVFLSFENEKKTLFWLNVSNTHCHLLCNRKSSVLTLFSLLPSLKKITKNGKPIETN